MRTQEAASDRPWRSMRLAFPLAVVSLTAWAGGPPDAASLSITQPAVAQPASSPSLALARYIASLGHTMRRAEWQTVTVEIEASLPGLAKQGRLQAIRRSGASGRPEYQVLHIEGDSIVKQQVIARYLTAEKEAEAIPKASVTVSPANYKFRYVGSIASSGTFVYVYQVTPRKKRAGLMEGQLWIDAGTGLPCIKADTWSRNPRSSCAVSNWYGTHGFATVCRICKLPALRSTLASWGVPS